MIPVLLARTKTKDGVTLNGVIIAPKKKTDTAFIWVHGYTSCFYAGQTRMKELANHLNRNRIAYLNFNTRGHDIVSDQGKKLYGAAFEKFEDCVKDIRAIISFARKLGYKKIILAGHSTGANKVSYYLYKTKDRAVKKLVLLGPISDIPGEVRKLGKKNLAKRLAVAEKLNKKDPKLLIPQNFEICSAGRYVSMYRPGMPEDTFPYHDPKLRWKALESIKMPMLVVVGSRDEYIDRPAKDFIEAFRKNAIKTKKFSGVIIKKSGHSFTKKEKELAKVIVDWIKKI